MEYQLELIDVAKQYKDFLAVDRVNMQIKKGRSYLFLEPADAERPRLSG